MQVDIGQFIQPILVILGLVGFSIASYIYIEKKKKKKLICPNRFDCDSVINSDYSVIGPFQVEVLGMFYYLFITIAFLLSNKYLNWTLFLKQIFFVISCISVMFSIYLSFIQAFLIRHWCIWCLSSAIISILISLLIGYYLYI